MDLGKPRPGRSHNKISFMSMLIWNIRVMGSRASSDYLKYLLSIHKPIMLGIIEPKQQRSKIGDFAIKLGYSDFCHGNEVNNHIWLFWNNMSSVQVLEVTPQTLYLKIGIPGMAEFLLSLLYMLNAQGRKGWNYGRVLLDRATPRYLG